MTTAPRKTTTIAFASQKGGAGKSTLAVNIAAKLSNSGKTILVDLDPQGSAKFWYTQRPEELKHNLKFVNMDASAFINSDVPGDFRFTVIDTPPLSSTLIMQALEKADMIVIPVSASSFDLAALKNTLYMAVKTGNPYGVVLNSVKKTTALENVKSALRAMKEVGEDRLVCEIVNRTAFVNSAAEGLSVEEYGRDIQATEEINTLFQLLQKAFN